MADNNTYYLVEAYLEDRLSAAEREELELLVATKASEEEIVEALQQYLALLEPDSAVDAEALAHIWKDAVAVDKDTQPAKIISLQKSRWRMWVAAAAVVVVMVGGWWWARQAANLKPETPTIAERNDIPAPTNTRAVITLADGSKVYLDSAGNGTIAKENNVAVMKKSDGSIIYSHEGTKEQSEITYNTLFNPRGSKIISLTLSDGTKVWLNSESSLRYPASFAATAVREVEITGEAYFEVKHDAKQPFKVHLPNGGVIEDIGTAFNVNAYTDENDIKTTLIEGSVQIFASSANTSASSALKIKPGEQAVLNTTSHSLLTTSAVDLDEILAWQRGRFEFNNAELPTILRQVSRWYDVDVVYEHQPKLGPLGGGISRNLPLSEVLKLLEANGAKFRLEGRKLIVL